MYNIKMNHSSRRGQIYKTSHAAPFRKGFRHPPGPFPRSTDETVKNSKSTHDPMALKPVPALAFEDS